MSQSMTKSDRRNFTFHLLLFLFAVFYHVVTERFAVIGPIGGSLVSEGLLFFVALLYVIVSPVPVCLVRRPLTGKDVLWVAVFIVSAYPVLMLVNGYFLQYISEHLFLSDRVGTLFQGRQSLGKDLLVFALVPGIAEELFFRGVLFERYRQKGPFLSIFLTALFFALFHFNLQNFVAPFFLGLLLGSVVWWTGSVFCAVEAHILHNVAGVLFLRGFTPENIRRLQMHGIVHRLGGVEQTVTLVLWGLSILGVILAYWGHLALREGSEVRIRGQAPLMPEHLVGYIPIGFLVLYYFIIVF